MHSAQCHAWTRKEAASFALPPRYLIAVDTADWQPAGSQHRWRAPAGTRASVAGARKLLAALLQPNEAGRRANRDHCWAPSRRGRGGYTGQAASNRQLEACFEPRTASSSSSPALRVHVNLTCSCVEAIKIRARTTGKKKKIPPSTRKGNKIIIK